MNAHLAEPIDARATRLRLSFSEAEIAALQSRLDSAESALEAARGREHGVAINARLDRVAVAQEALDAALEYVTAAEELYVGQVVRLDDDLAVIRRIDEEHIEVERSALGSRAASHMAGCELLPVSPLREVSLQFVMDGAGSPLEAGDKGQVLVPFAGQLKSASLLANQAGSAVVDITRSDFTSLPDAGISITGSSKPTLDSAATYHDPVLDGWTPGLDAGHVLHVVLESATAVERLTLVLTIGT